MPAEFLGHNRLPAVSSACLAIRMRSSGSMTEAATYRSGFRCASAPRVPKARWGASTAVVTCRAQCSPARQHPPSISRVRLVAWKAHKGSSAAEPESTEPAACRGMDRIGAGAEGTDGRVSPSQQPTRPARSRGEAEVWVYKPDAKPQTHKAVVDFGEGLEFRTDDDEYRLQFHNLTQAEFRGFPTANQGILQSQFYIPRQRWYFTGDLTKNVGFYTVINRGYGSLDLLDAFMTLRVRQPAAISYRPDEDTLSL